MSDSFFSTIKNYVTDNNDAYSMARLSLTLVIGGVVAYGILRLAQSTKKVILGFGKDSELEDKVKDIWEAFQTAIREQLLQDQVITYQIDNEVKSKAHIVLCRGLKRVEVVVPQLKINDWNTFFYYILHKGENIGVRGEAIPRRNRPSTKFLFDLRNNTSDDERDSLGPTSVGNKQQYKIETRFKNNLVRNKVYELSWDKKLIIPANITNLRYYEYHISKILPPHGKKHINTVINYHFHNSKINIPFQKLDLMTKQFGQALANSKNEPTFLIWDANTDQHMILLVGHLLKMNIELLTHDNLDKILYEMILGLTVPHLPTIKQNTFSYLYRYGKYLIDEENKKNVDVIN